MGTLLVKVLIFANSVAALLLFRLKRLCNSGLMLAAEANKDATPELFPPAVEVSLLLKDILPRRNW